MRGDPAGARHDPRVGGEHAVDVGVDLADVGAERGGERDRGGVGAAAAEGGDVLGVLADALEAGDDRDRRPRRAPARIRPGVTSMIRALPCAESVMTPAWLPVNDRASWPRSCDGHREQRHRDALAGGQQHVELARRRQRARPAGRGRAARRWCRPSRRRRRRRRGRPCLVSTMRSRDPLDALGVGDGGAAVLLHDQAHGCSSLRRDAVSPVYEQADTPGCIRCSCQRDHCPAGQARSP